MKFNTGHLKQQNQTLRFSESKKVKLTFSRMQAQQMYLLWLRFRNYADKQSLRIGDLYRDAFSKFLFVNKVPKQLPKVERAQREMQFDAETVKMLDDIRKIAAKRNQPLAVVVEEALQTFLDMPENYLGKDQVKAGKVERIS